MSAEEDLEMDTTQLAQAGPPYPIENEDDLHNLLIEINEDLSSEDLEVLKFLLYDKIPASKLQNADSALSIFENLKKGNKISHTNIDILLECLWWMHRKDLIRKLKYDPAEVGKFIPGMHEIIPFRKLLLELREDITEKEFETMKFYLDGKVKKKKLQEKKDLMELFIFLEQEGLISHVKPDSLITLLKSIKRVDLIEQVQKYSGKEPKPSSSRIPNQGQVADSRQNVQSVAASRNRQPAQAVIRPVEPPQPAVERLAPVGGGDRGNNVPEPAVGDVRHAPIDRSPSAGTLSAPSSLEDLGTAGSEQGILPEALLRSICQDVKDIADDFGIELGFSNVDIGTYRNVYQNPADRCYNMIKHWQNSRLDSGQVGPGLKYVLDKLGYKQSSKAVADWMSALSVQTQQQPQTTGYQPVPPPEGPPVFQPTGPPANNNYTILREAQVVNMEPPQPLPANPPQVGNDMMTSAAQFLPDNINLADLNQQLQQLSMAGGVPNVNTQIPPLSQHPMHYPVMNMEPAVIPPQGQGQLVLQTVPQPTPMEEDTISMELPVYPVTHSPKGICIIINNRVFNVSPNDPASKEMPERRGTEVDAANLRDTFTTLDFEVEVHENLSDTGMMRVLVDIAQNRDHTRYDCFVCCILSHGVLNHLYGTNGKLVQIKDLTGVFQSNRCPSLAGKPKLFFLQACQGRDKMGGGEIERDASPHPSQGRVPGDVETDNNDREMIPNESDFLVGYATVPGYVSFRSRNHGSWYIRKLCENLEKFSERHDLMSILVKVNEEVSLGNAHVDGGIFKQTPAPVVTLRKKLFFFNRNRRIN